MSRRRRLRGFTLIELLVATTILTLMVVLLVEMLNRTSAVWLLGQAQTERRQSARAIGDSMAQELQSALMPLDPADQKSLQFTLNSAAIPPEYRYADTLFWQAPIATDRTRGDVAEVGYFLKWDEAKAGHPRPLLCRFFVNPADTDNYQIIKQPDGWLSGHILDLVAPANNQKINDEKTGGEETNKPKTNGYAGLFAENVLGFWARCYDKDGRIWKVYDSREKQALPRTAKIFLVLIGPESLSRLTAKPDYSIAETGDEPDLEAFIKALPPGIRQTARAFTTEIQLQNAP